MHRYHSSSFKNKNTEGYNKINNWPLNFLRTGQYTRSEGYINVRTSNGYWWLSVSSFETDGHDLVTSLTDVRPQDNSYRGRGYAVRWGAWRKEGLFGV